MKLPLFLILLALITTPSYGTLRSLDKIIVIVNDDVITQQELTTRTGEYKKKLKLKNLSADDLNSLTKQVLEKMIRTRIQLQRAEKLGIIVDDVALNRIIEKIANGNKLSLKELEEAIKSEGMSYTGFREQTRNDLIIKQLQERLVASKINVTNQEIQQFIKLSQTNDQNNRKYHLSHILISTPEAARPEDINSARKKANKLYSQIVQGGEFSEIALKHSNGRNALKGGDLGWRKANELPVVFLEAISELKVGEVTKPVRSAGGFHILKINGSSKNVEMIEQTHARHILIRTGANTSDTQAKNTLSDIKHRLSSGEAFAKLAAEYSQDPGSKDNGGDLGWVNPGTFVADFENTMNLLKAGDISQPFRSQFGWHILQVLERRKKDKTDEILHSQARKTIHKRKTEEELQLWLRRIHDESYIEYKISNLGP